MNASQPNPPDETGSASEREPLDGGAELDADPMLDVMLTEVFGETSRQAAPPDQTRVILDRFHHAPVVASKANPPTSKTEAANPIKSGQLGWLLAVAATVMVLGSVAWQVRSQFDVAQLNKPIETESTKDLDSLSSGFQATEPGVAESRGLGDSANEPSWGPGTKPDPGTRRVIELAGPSVADPEVSDLAQPEGPDRDARSIAKPPQSIQLVSKTMVDHLDRYWNRIGVVPTALMSNTESVERLQERFGLEISADEFADPGLLAAALVRDKNRSALATRLMMTWSSRFESSKDPMVQSVTNQMKQALKNRSGMDDSIASWFASSNVSAEKVKQPVPETNHLIGRMTRSLGTHEALVRTVSLTHNRDLRCSRCHDTPSIGSSETSQDEYWQFAASFLPILRADRGSDGKLFYDTLDGRRRLAKRSEDLNPTSQNLIGSAPLASGLVDWVWRAIHGKPLVSSPYDLAGAANSEMQKLHRELAEDLLASDFDLVRTIALVMTHSIISRRVPDAMTPEGLLVANDTDWVEAVVAIDSFAASAPASQATTPKQRARLVAQIDLPSLEKTRSRGAILAQPIGSDETTMKPVSPKSPLLASRSTPREVSQAALSGFPMRSTVVMPAWLKQLPTLESRRQHIAHLAGQLELDSSTAKLANQMVDAGIDETLILERIWWIVRPAGI